jgi:hypothetical protein
MEPELVLVLAVYAVSLGGLATLHRCALSDPDRYAKASRAIERRAPVDAPAVDPAMPTVTRRQVDFERVRRPTAAA